MAAARGKKASSKKTTKSKKSSSKSSKRSSNSKRTRKSSPKKATSIRTGISPERKIDLLGVGLALIGLLSLLSLFSNDMEGFWGQWNHLLMLGVGWGKILLPIGLIVIGIWLIARNVDFLPNISVERIIGIVLLFVNLLVVFQGFTTFIPGEGGGYLGSSILQALNQFLGGVGAVILIIAWLLIALAMSLDLSIRELFQWTIPLLAQIRERFTRREKTTSHPPIYSQESLPEEPQDNFTPLTTSTP